MTISERKMNPQELRRYEEWERKFRLSEKFIREFGRMPLVREKYDGECLYRWLILEKIKYMNGKMTQETVERFRKIGVDIAHFSARPKIDQKKPPAVKTKAAIHLPVDEIFEKELNLLKQFIEMYDRFPEPEEQFDHYPIGKTCEKWRRQYRNKQISEKRVKELTKIDFPWTATELKWRKNYLLLQDFLKKYNRFPFAGEVYYDLAIGTWLYHQRQLFRKGKLTEKHLQLLEKLDFMNSPRLKTVTQQKTD